MVRAKERAMSRYEVERIETIVVGGGQSGLAMGYHLARRGLPFVIVDAHPRIGDAWRTRWDSLKLFTPAGYDGLPGMRFPAPRTSYPTKDEMADYLEAYARRFELPVRTGVRVDALARDGDRFVLAAGDVRFEADNVVVAMSSDLRPWKPDFALLLDPRLVQLHAFDYRNPSQLQDGDVLIVGAGNSGADIAMEVVNEHRTLLSGRDVGHIPFPINRFTAGTGYPFFRFAFHRVLKANSRPGRKMKREFAEGHGLPLVRVKPKHLARAGVERVPRTVGVRDGLPLLEDDRIVDVANVIWCTGFRPDVSWIDLPIFDEYSEPAHTRGIVDSEPGLYFTGLDFLYAASSGQINGIGRDANHVAKAIAARGRRSGVANALAPA
jgi:putative flavoprotein involved in K+ transport